MCLLFHAKQDLLTNYNTNAVNFKGDCYMSVHYGKDRGVIHHIIVKGQKACLLGEEWFVPLGIKLKEVHSLATNSVQGVLKEFSTIFKELGPSV